MNNINSGRLWLLFFFLLLFGVLDVDLVVASTNGHTQAEAVQWANDKAREHYEINDGSGWTQCTEFVWAYYEYLLGYHVGGHAYHYLGDSYGACPAGWTRPDKYSAQPGDIVVWGANARFRADGTDWCDGYGHIGVIVSVNGNSMVTVEANAGEARGAAGYKYNREVSYITGLIRPDFAVPPNHNPKIYFDGVDVSNGRVHVVGWTYDPDAVDRSIGVDVYLFQNGNPTCIGHATANVSRVDVDNALHIGQFHGFDSTFETSIRGAVEVQVAALNIGEGDHAWSDKKNITIVETGSPMQTGYDRVIPDGDYLIANTGAVNNTSFYYLDIEGTSVPAPNDTNVSLCGPLSGDPPSFEIWTVSFNNDDKFYSIKQKDTDMSLDVAGGSIDRGANVRVHTSNNSAAQKWAISKNGRNGYRVQVKCSGYSLDVENGSISNGSQVRQWEGNDTNAQSWVFIPYKPLQPIKNGRYVLISALDDSMELDVSGDTGNISNDANVQIWEDTCYSKYNSFDITKLSNGYYKLTHAVSGLVLDSCNAASKYSENICVHTDNGTTAQQWAIVKSGGYYYLQPRCSGYAMDVESSQIANGTNVSQYPYHGKENQLWKFVEAEYTVSYNANGGSDVPESQIKYYKNDLTLSSKNPSRSEYLFLGWSESPLAKKAEYHAGDLYTVDEDVTLYAVWLKKTQQGEIEIPDSVTAIEDSAFAGCSNLISVKIPDTVIKIGKLAFSDCYKLENIEIPDAVSMIEDSAFFNCKNLTLIVGRDSYARQYAIENDIPYTYSD